MRIPLPVVLSLVPAALASQGAPESTGFLWRLGTDTTQIERITRLPRGDRWHRLEGVHVTRVPATAVREWSADLAPDGSVRRFEQTLRRAGAVVSRRAMVFAGDSVTHTVTRGDSTVAQTMAAPAGTLPDLPSSYAFVEVAVGRLAGRDSIAFGLLAPGGDVVERAALVRHRGDTVALHLEGLPTIWLRIDGAGRIVWADNLGTIVQRVPAPDVAALAAAFEPRPLGALSPRDTVRAVVGGAHVLVDYGRPARRGRQIFGGLVPWDRVWRTGANRTTTLVTDADLLIGGVTVPAGSHALFTLPTASGWTLIVNRNVGSGLEYDAQHDIGRTPLEATTVPELVERFTIALEPDEAGAVLSFTWEHTRASVTVRRR